MSKLLKFKAWLEADEAAILLGRLISEEVDEFDLLSLSNCGHLPSLISAEEGFIGFPVIPPQPNDSEQDLWTVHPATSQPPLPPFAIHAETLFFPMAWLRTDLGFAPCNAASGLFYAWFALSSDDDGITFGQHGKLKLIDQDDVWNRILFRPNDLVRIASEANERDTPAQLPLPKEAGQASGFDDCGKRITVQLFPTPLRSISALTEKPDTPPPSSTNNLLVIAALLELLKAPVERTRPAGMNQDRIKGLILENFPWRGLGERNLDTIFSAANKAKKAAE